MSATRNLEASRGPFLSVAETASHLGVSVSWVRRHIAELPTIRAGRLIRIDSASLQRTLEYRKPLEPTRRVMPSRFQRGGVFKVGNTWKGTFRLDTPEGKR